MKKNTYKLLIVMVIALTMFCFGNKTSYTILENSKELYYANNIVITESMSDSTIKTLFENVVAGESLTIRGTIELNNILSIPTGATVVVEDGAELKVNRTLTNNGILNVDEGGTLTLKADLKLGRNSNFNNSGTVKFGMYGITPVYSESTTEDKYATITLNSCLFEEGTVIGSEYRLNNILLNTKNVKIENYCRSINSNMTSLFNSNNIINNHVRAIKNASENTYYDDFNSIPNNTTVEIEGVVLLNSNQTINETVTVTVKENTNSLVYIGGDLEINGTLTMNNNVLIVNDLKGSGDMHIIVSTTPSDPYTKVSGLNHSLNIYVDSTDVKYGDNIITLTYGSSRREKDVSDYIGFLEELNLKSTHVGVVPTLLDYLNSTDISLSLFALGIPGGAVIRNETMYITFAYKEFPDAFLYECILDTHYNLNNEGSRPSSYNSLLTSNQFNEIENLTCQSNGHHITNLTGLEKLTNLTTLDLTKHPITGIDLSSLTKIDTVKLNDCINLENVTFDNPSLKTLELEDTKIDKFIVPNDDKTYLLEDLKIRSTLFNELDLVKANNIKTIIVDTPLNLTSNIGKKSNLEVIKFTGLGSNNITIDLSDSVNIKEIVIPKANISSLVLNENASSLTYLNLNYNELTSIDLTKHTNLEYLNLDDN